MNWGCQQKDDPDTATPKGLQHRGGSAEERDLTPGNSLVSVFQQRSLAPAGGLCPGLTAGRAPGACAPAGMCAPPVDTCLQAAPLPSFLLEQDELCIHVTLYQQCDVSVTRTLTACNAQLNI